MNAESTDQPRPEGYDRAMQLEQLTRAVKAVLDAAPDDVSQDERTAVLLDAAVDGALFADRWCSDCQATNEGMCTAHDTVSDRIDDARRVLWARLGVTLDEAGL